MRSKNGELLSSITLSTFKLNGEFLRQGNLLSREFNLTGARWQTLAAIKSVGHPVTVSKAARIIGLTRQAVQRVANELERRNMIEFKNNEDHKRAKLISLTSKGNKTLSHIDRKWNLWVNDLSKELSTRELIETDKTLMKIMKKITTEE